MKRKSALLAVILVSVTVPAAAAEESGAGKPVTSPVEKADPAAEEHKLDFKELFGCEPMGENGHTPKPVSGVSGPAAMQPAQEKH